MEDSEVRLLRILPGSFETVKLCFSVVPADNLISTLLGVQKGCTGATAQLGGSRAGAVAVSSRVCSKVAQLGLHLRHPELIVMPMLFCRSGLRL